VLVVSLNGIRSQSIADRGPDVLAWLKQMACFGSDQGRATESHTNPEERVLWVLISTSNQQALLTKGRIVKAQASGAVLSISATCCSVVVSKATDSTCTNGPWRVPVKLFIHSLAGFADP
jgi:hypothetical protein